jgi:hypothetical protein
MTTKTLPGARHNCRSALCDIGGRRGARNDAGAGNLCGWTRASLTTWRPNTLVSMLSIRGRAEQQRRAAQDARPDELKRDRRHRAIN